MKILIVNPNTTASMTEKIGKAAALVAGVGTDIIATNSQDGPASIQGYLDAATCLPGLLAEVKRHPDADAVIVACFDDTGLDALRCVCDVPVIGIGEAAYHAAAMVSPKFSVITTLSRSVVGLEANLRNYGLDRRCVQVRASDIPVLKLEEGDPATLDIIRSEIERAITKDKAEAIVLGCAGMTDLMEMLTREYNMPIIDGISCAVVFAEGLARMGLKTSKRNTYNCD